MVKRSPARRALIALGTLACGAAAVFLLLWLNPHRSYTYEARTLPQAEAVKACPFALITRQEFQLAAELLANENVTAFYPNPGQVDPPAHELPVGLVDAEALRIGGQRARVTSLSVFGLMICVDYSTPVPDVQSPRSRCTLSIAYDGTVVKTSAQYENGVALYIVDNTDNAAFIVGRNVRDLLYFLHDN